jgi:hypothetical protein
MFPDVGRFALGQYDAGRGDCDLTGCLVDRAEVARRTDQQASGCELSCS